ncbi:MAG TPA: segregation/condensation protein A [Usitatibacter sp.]|jgi:segregation and condensation protein A|nr:segregation/condensation protein A [Usitatibacter sp.]
MTTHAANDPVQEEAQPVLDLALPIAKIRGEPLTELPQDLYIPPEALSVFLDAFEGPLDLLLYLIRRHSLDILDIPMAELTRQYMEYVEMMRATQLELAAEYLLMAALLIEIKSRMLLPRPRREDEAEPEDPRAELVRRLLEYERIKRAAHSLGEAPVAGRDFSIVEVYIEQVAERLPEVHVADLSNAWRSILARARMNKHHRITREELSVRSHMSRILRSLAPGAFVEFSQLFEPERGVPLLVVSFLACLELARESLIEISQQSPFDPIYVKLKSERTTLTIA